MTAKVLTVQSVERHKPNPERRLEIPDATLPGFYLVVQPSGAKSWAVRYRINGQPRKYTIGAYPLFDLGAARARAREALQMVALGRDPYVEKKAAAAAAHVAEKDRVAHVATLYVERHLKPNAKPGYAETAAALITNHVLPRWGNRRIGDIGRIDVIALVDGLTDKGMATGANRVFATTRAMFNFALARGMIPTTPFLGLKPPLAETSRDRVLTDAEVRLVWKAAEAVGYPFGPMVQLLLLTGQRRDEVGKMVWPELDGSVWTIPAVRTKNSLEHVVPLSPQAIAILDAAPRIAGAGYVLTRSGTTAAADYSAGKKRLDAAMLAIATKEEPEQGRDLKAVSVPPWRLHDLRRTCSSGMARLKVTPHVIEAVLNHRSGTISGVAAVYNRYAYFDEKRAALETWARKVRSLVDA
ncbi:tyrosine-type recombinase/integrase [Methylobacterium terricola]|uniref:tyrosine-type recombinase/integrase n=1 Tax=Methylobacterium terricola TaxID=2583531 RepID=UPI001486F57C|nr:site-specific integrase [Methylobacterium terricola]